MPWAAGGVGLLRELVDTCGWCGEECIAAQEMCVSCACNVCGPKLYHQACVEKYLKKNGLSSQRKCGYPCASGKGKVQDVAECKGKVQKSHPIVPSNEEKKAKKAINEYMLPQHKPKEKEKGGVAPAALKQPALPKPPKQQLPGGIPRKAQAACQVVVNGRRHAVVNAPQVAPLAERMGINNVGGAVEGEDEAAIPGMEALRPKAAKKNAKRKKKAAVELGSAASDGAATPLHAPGSGSLLSGAQGGDGGDSSHADTSEWGTAERELLDRAVVMPNEYMGTRGFVSDPEAYARLLKQYMGSVSSDDEDELDEGAESAQVINGALGEQLLQLGGHAHAGLAPEGSWGSDPAGGRASAAGDAGAADQAAEDERLLQEALRLSAAEAEERARLDAKREAVVLAQWKQQADSDAAARAAAAQPAVHVYVAQPPTPPAYRAPSPSPLYAAPAARPQSLFVGHSPVLAPTAGMVKPQGLVQLMNGGAAAPAAMAAGICMAAVDSAGEEDEEELGCLLNMLGVGA